jgi:hypothetical protein
MLAFEDVVNNYGFVHARGRVIVNPFPVMGVISVTNGTLFEGTRAECEAEYERLGLDPLEDKVGEPHEQRR